MSVAIDVNDQKLWNTYKTFAEDKGDGKAGELDDLFGDDDAEPEDDEDDPAPAPTPDPDEDDEDDGPASASEPDDEDEDLDLPPMGSDDEEEADEEGDEEREAPESGEAAGGDPNGDGGTEDIDIIPPEFDEELAQKISEEARSTAREADYIIYTRDFDRIEPLTVDASPEGVKKGLWKDKWLTELEDQTRGMTGVMAKDIERMMAARSQVLRVPGYRSGRLHSAGLHRLLAGDGRVFRRKHEQQSKDVAVCLLNDNSGSMMGEKMSTAMTASFALASTLERVAIKHEVLGFTTFYNQKAGKEAAEEYHRTGIAFSRIMPIYMPVYKGFEERLTPEIKRRFAAAPHGRFMNANVDGESVEYAVGRLMKRNEKRKVLIVLSDGQPAADGDYAEQIAHLHRTVENAERMGIETIGIGILSDAVRHYYPKHFVLNKVEQLPGLVMQELKRILAA